MNKLVVAALVCTLLTLTGCEEQKQEKVKSERAAANVIEQNIYRAADSMLAAYNRRDWITFVRYNHPNMTKRMGGEKAFASFVEMQMKQIPDSVAVRISIGKIIQVVETHRDVQCLVEQKMNMKIADTTLDKTTYLLGESVDDGNSWTFFDVTTKTGLSPKDIKPDISDQLKIPAT